MFDAAIVGGGPGGLSAALTLKLHNKDLIWFGSPDMSAKVERSERIANYPGVPMVTGEALNAAFRKQAEELGLIPDGRMVTNIAPAGEGWMLLADNEVVEAKTVLLATGAVTGKGLPGEEALLGRGVSYCATCDGFLYKGKTIALFCAGERFLHEAEYLSELGSRVYFYSPDPSCRMDRPNVTILSSPIVSIQGEGRAAGVTLADGTAIPVDGVFLLRNGVAPASLLRGLRLEEGHIAVDRQGRTNFPGCYAAGDCTGRPYQIAKAVGEGNVAAHAILNELDGKKA